MENNDITKLISVKEAMGMMGVKRTTFYSQVKKGKIELKYFGSRKSLVPIESVQQWIDSLPTSNGGGSNE